MITLILSFYVMVVTGISVNESVINGVVALCHTVFWYMMRISGVVMAVLLFFIMLALTIKVLRAIKPQSSYDSIL